MRKKFEVYQCFIKNYKYRLNAIRHANRLQILGDGQKWQMMKTSLQKRIEIHGTIQTYASKTFPSKSQYQCSAQATAQTNGRFSANDAACGWTGTPLERAIPAVWFSNKKIATPLKQNLLLSSAMFGPTRMKGVELQAGKCYVEDVTRSQYLKKNTC